MKRKYKYTLIVEISGFIGSYLIYAFCIGRFDIWNLPDGYFRMFLGSVLFMGIVCGILMNTVENELNK